MIVIITVMQAVSDSLLGTSMAASGVSAKTQPHGLTLPIPT